MDFDIFTPEYKKEQKALERARELLSRAAAAAAARRPSAAFNYVDVMRFLATKRELMVQHKKAFSGCYVEAACALYTLGKKDEAFKCFEFAIEVSPELASGWAELGKSLLRENKFESAMGYLDRALVLGPDDAETWVAKGDVMRALMEYGEARMCYVKALELEPLRIESYDRLLQIGPADAEVLKGKAVALSISGAHDEALMWFRTAVEKDPRSPSILTEMGRALGRAGKRDDAIASFDKAISLNPAYKGAPLAKGKMLAEMGKTKEALEFLDVALKLDPLDPDALSASAELLVTIGKAGDASDYLTRALEQNPKNVDLLTRKGAALFSLGKFDEALKLYETAITIDPDDSLCWAGKGRNLAELGRHEEALKYLAKASELEPTNAVYAIWMARALAISGKHESAIAALDVAITHMPGSLEALELRAECLLSAGRTEEAARSFNRAIDLDACNKAVWYGRAQCSARLEKYDEALVYTDKALALDANYREALDLKALASQMRNKSSLEAYSKQVLDFEQRNNRMPTREEAFRDCRIPFEVLDTVMAHVGASEVLDIEKLNMAEKTELDNLASGLIRRAAPGAELKLSYALKLLPGVSVLKAKRVLGFIVAVRELSIPLPSPLDPHTEELCRAGLRIPDSSRGLIELVRTLEIGLLEARRVEEVLDAIRGGPGPHIAPRSREEPDPVKGEVPESELETSPDLTVPGKKVRRPRKKPVLVTESPSLTALLGIKTQEPPAREEPEDETEDGPENILPEKEEPGEPDGPCSPAPVKRPRRRKSAVFEPAEESESEAPSDEEAGPADPSDEKHNKEVKEELDDSKIQDISDSLKDIVTSIEKREEKREKEKGAEKDRAGRGGRTYCSVCHTIIATIHHGCGAHLCSRCVIDFNKDRRAEKNLCPKCLKPIETAAPSPARAGWRDTL